MKLQPPQGLGSGQLPLLVLEQDVVMKCMVVSRCAQSNTLGFSSLIYFFLDNYGTSPLISLVISVLILTELKCIYFSEFAIIHVHFGN
jgi:hypothetical protein